MPAKNLERIQGMASSTIFIQKSQRNIYTLTCYTNKAHPVHIDIPCCEHLVDFHETAITHINIDLPEKVLSENRNKRLLLPTPETKLKLH